MNKYRVFRPNAGTVSEHRTFEGAMKSLKRQEGGSAKQGGFCQDYIQIRDEETGEFRNLGHGEYDPDADIRDEI